MPDDHAVVKAIGVVAGLLSTFDCEARVRLRRLGFIRGYSRRSSGRHRALR
jgi:hypothetical protein